MSFEICILTDNGRPQAGVALKPEEYFKLFGQLEAALFPLLSKMADFYEDAEFPPSELPALECELLRVVDQGREGKETLGKIIEMARTALVQGNTVAAIAD